MNHNLYLKNLKNSWQLILTVVALLLIITLAVTVIQPLKYRASVELLVIAKQSKGIDAYSAMKTTEKIAENLSNIIYTSSFFNKVMNANDKINKQQFSKNEVKKRKQWKKTVDTTVIRETGIFKIDVYNEDPKQAHALASTIAYVISSQGNDYHGGGNNIEIKVIDFPYTSNYPVKPNIILNAMAAIMLGLAISGTYVILTTDEIAEINGAQIDNDFKINETARVKEAKFPANLPISEYGKPQPTYKSLSGKTKEMINNR